MAFAEVSKKNKSTIQALSPYKQIPQLILKFTQYTFELFIYRNSIPDGIKALSIMKIVIYR